MHQILKYSDFFAASDWAYIYEKLSSPNWFFGQYSVGDVSDALPFWKMHLNDDNFFSKYIFEKIAKKIELDVKVIDIYANGQTHGQDGCYHKDDCDFTFLIYANREWKVEWGGRTIFVDSNHENSVVLSPIPRTSILFKSDTLHYAESPSRNCYQLRKTIAYKLTLN